MQRNLFEPKTRNLNMSLPYARVIVSTRNIVVIRTWAPCLYLKNDVAHGLSCNDPKFST